MEAKTGAMRATVMAFSSVVLLASCDRGAVAAASPTQVVATAMPWALETLDPQSEIRAVAFPPPPEDMAHASVLDVGVESERRIYGHRISARSEPMDSAARNELRRTVARAEGPRFLGGGIATRDHLFFHVRFGERAMLVGVSEDAASVKLVFGGSEVVAAGLTEEAAVALRELHRTTLR